MIRRERWIGALESLWKQKSILWLSGVRRIGKTVLARQLPGIEYYNCDLPSVRRELEDPELFLRNRARDARIVLDEIHRLPEPSLVLKIAADEFPRLQVLATGSSTLEATRKFRDTLTGRKRAVHLAPVLWSECRVFGTNDINRRLRAGGFPEMLLAGEPDPGFFSEWIDSFYARDVQELFGVRNRTGFLALLHLLLLRSGGELDVTDLAKEAGLSRPTVLSHLEALQIAHVMTRVPPWHGGGHREIVRRPRIYGFDTGLVCHVKGWESIRDTDRGYLWEHLVLDELQAAALGTIHYWRDKSGREVDFVLKGAAGKVIAVEAKIQAEAVEPENLRAFRLLYPAGKNYVVSPHVRQPYVLRRAGLEIIVCSPDEVAVR